MSKCHHAVWQDALRPRFEQVERDGVIYPVQVSTPYDPSMLNESTPIAHRVFYERDACPRCRGGACPDCEEDE